MIPSDPTNLRSYFYFDGRSLIYGLSLSLELVLLYPLFAYLKWNLLAHLGMSVHERLLVFSNRRQGFNLNYFVTKYGDRNLRIVDGLSRKLLHLSIGAWELAFLNLIVKDSLLAFQVVFIYKLIQVTLSGISYSSNQVLGLAGIMYGASSRIRDGIDGRKNILIVRLSFMSLFPLVWIEYIARTHVTDEAILIFFSLFIFLPLTVGDAMGEIVGGIWGKQNLQVWGVGQINRKSVLGTLSVFLGSLVPLLFIVAYNHLALPWWLLCFVVSANTAAIELIAPRSTDNFFIPIGNGLICLNFIIHLLPT